MKTPIKQGEQVRFVNYDDRNKMGLYFNKIYTVLESKYNSDFNSQRVKIMNEWGIEAWYYFSKENFKKLEDPNKIIGQLALEQHRNVWNELKRHLKFIDLFGFKGNKEQFVRDILTTPTTTIHSMYDFGKLGTTDDALTYIESFSLKKFKIMKREKYIKFIQFSMSPNSRYKGTETGRFSCLTSNISNIPKHCTFSFVVDATGQYLNGRTWQSWDRIRGNHYARGNRYCIPAGNSLHLKKGTYDYISKGKFIRVN